MFTKLFTNGDSREHALFRSLTISFTHLAALAAMLEIPQPRIRQTLDESRAIYTVAPPRAPGPQLDALLTLEETLKACRQTYVRAKWVLNLVKALRISAQGKPVG